MQPESERRTVSTHRCKTGMSIPWAPSVRTRELHDLTPAGFHPIATEQGTQSLGDSVSGTGGESGSANTCAMA